MKTDRKKVKAEAKSLVSEVLSHGEDMSKVEAKLNELFTESQTQIAELQAEIAASKDQNTKLAESNSDLKAEKEDLEKTVADKEAELEKLNKELEAKAAELEEMKASLESMKQEASTQKRMKMMRLMEYLTGIGNILVAESSQGGAPTANQQLVVNAEMRKLIEEAKVRVLELAGIDD